MPASGAMRMTLGIYASIAYGLIAATTFWGIRLARPWALRVGLVDRPGSRKRHRGEVPLTGGLAMGAGLLVAMVLLGAWLAVPLGVCVGAVMILAMGVADDRLALPARLRLVGQILAGVCMVWGGVVIADVGGVFGGDRFSLGWFAWPFTVFAVVGLINAFNMLDGVDGLCGGVAMVILAALAILAAMAGMSAELLGILAVMAVLAAFLLLNFPFSVRSQASVFMGDAGSMLIGYLIAWLAIDLSQGEKVAFEPVTALLLLALPVCDTLAIMLRRVIKGVSPLRADRTHMHHLLLRSGFDRRQTVVLIGGLTAVSAAIGLLAEWWQAPAPWLLGVFLVLLAAHCLLMVRAWQVVRWLRRNRMRTDARTELRRQTASR